MRRIFYVIIISLFIAVSGVAQTNNDIQKEYIERYKDIAIEEMNQFKVPASITLAQGVLESNAGRSRLATKGNNHFGIKCHSGWKGKRIYEDDDAVGECFRKYKDPAFSYRDHSLFLTTRSRYAALFELDITDYKGWSKGLKKAGYATNPKYAHLLIGLIERHKLYKYDKYFSEEPVAYRKPENAIPVPTYNNLTAVDFANARKVFINNGKKLIVAGQEDSFLAIGEDTQVELYDLKYFNELPVLNQPEDSSFVYIERKRWRSKVFKHHYVRKEDTWHTIAQTYGIREPWLHFFNMGNAELIPGEKIRLRLF